MVFLSVTVNKFAGSMTARNSVVNSYLTLFLRFLKSNKQVGKGLRSG